MMDKFMGPMMGKMKPEEKEKMMTEMMEGMDMSKMMPMMGGNVPMTGMMKGMQEAMDKGFKPWEKCMRMEGYLKDIAQTNREMLEELKKK